MENMHTDARVERVNNWILFLWNTPECSRCKVQATEFELVTKVASSRYECVKKKKKKNIYIYIYIYITILIFWQFRIKNINMKRSYTIVQFGQ